MTNIHRFFVYGTLTLLALFLALQSTAGSKASDAVADQVVDGEISLTKEDENKELSPREKRKSGLYSGANRVSSSRAGLYRILNDFNLSSSGLIHGSENLELERYRERVKILHHMLREECPVDLLRRNRNHVSPQIEAAYEEIERLLFERMVRMLIECRQLGEDSTPTTTTPTTTTPTTPTAATPTTTTLRTTTTTTPPPSECLTATNLTEYWRKDHTGQSVGGVHCDTRDMQSDRPWFRFSGAAGSQLLNTCPPPNSCGTHIGMWSDEAMPLSVGQSINITVYGSWISGCKRNPSAASVMRCSIRPGDFIYMYQGGAGCNYGFCGMD